MGTAVSHASHNMKKDVHYLTKTQVVDFKPANHGFISDDTLSVHVDDKVKWLQECLHKITYIHK